MGKTNRKPHNSKLFHNGQRGHHNSLTREFKGVDGGGWMVKGIRGLIDRRDYESDRLKGIRRSLAKKRRMAMKRNDQKLIDTELNDE